MGEAGDGHGGARLVGLGGPVVLVLSPHAGSSGHGEDAGEEAARALRAAGVELGEVLLVSALDQSRPQCAEWLERGYAAAVAAGGDGTVGAVASHIAGTTLPLGILPLGTSNDTARSLGIPLDLDEATQVIAAGHTGQIDIGEAYPAQTAPLATTGDVVERTGLGAYFLHALTLGFNVQFARLATNVARRERLGGLNYAVSLVQALATFRPVAITLRFEGLAEAPEPHGEAHDEANREANAEPNPAELVVAQDALALAVVNMPVFGGALNLRVPQVAMHDRLLDFVLFEALDPQRMRATVEGALAALAHLPDRGESHRTPQQSQLAGAAAGQHADAELGLALPGIRRYKAREALIESERPLDVTLDGEVRAQTPLRVRVAPRPLAVLVPSPPR